jgi:hypothetical protein
VYRDTTRLFVRILANMSVLRTIHSGPEHNQPLRDLPCNFRFAPSRSTGRERSPVRRFINWLRAPEKKRHFGGIPTAGLGLLRKSLEFLIPLPLQGKDAHTASPRRLISQIKSIADLPSPMVSAQVPKLASLYPLSSEKNIAIPPATNDLVRKKLACGPQKLLCSAKTLSSGFSAQCNIVTS